MPRSSESVAALAAALAKAQAELINPEKSLTATIGTERGRGIKAFGMRPSRAASTSCAKRLVNTRLPPCRPQPSTRRLAWSI